MKHLAIGPGAMAYFAFLGAMGALRDCHELDNLEAISGASAGGLLAFFYVVAEGNIKTILDYSLDIPIKDIMKPNIRQFLKNFGLVSQRKIRNVIVDIISIFFSKKDLTFRELQDLRPTMPKVHISAYCVNLGRTEYFSCVSTPNMSVVDALCMTIAVPFLFATVEHQGRKYIDGGTMEDTPCGVFVGSTDVKVMRTVWSETPEYDTRNLKSYITSILFTMMRMRSKYNYPFIDIDMTKIEIFDFGVSTEAKLKMFSFGYHSTCSQVAKSYTICHPGEEDSPPQELHIDQSRHMVQCVVENSPDHPEQTEQNPRDEPKILSEYIHSSSSTPRTVQKTLDTES
jgi:predicted acylesterase/phospholipase RssA